MDSVLYHLYVNSGAQTQVSRLACPSTLSLGHLTGPQTSVLTTELYIKLEQGRWNSCLVLVRAGSVGNVTKVKAENTI